MSSKSCPIIDINAVKSRMLVVREQQILLDCDVAALYGVETKRINEAVRNNQDKFPPDYMMVLTASERDDLRTKISTTNLSSKSRALPKAFTEKGLYMLATILKSAKAVEATFAIIETFAQVRSLKRELLELNQPGAEKKTALMRHFGETLAGIVMPDPDVTETEASLELNFFVGKLKYTVRRTRKGGAQ